MELWIRSQTRKNLMKADDIVAVNNRILVYKDSDDCQTEVGEYKTEERALEVLNDIQDIIIAKYVTSLNSRAAMLETEEETTKVLKKMAVYEMPKE